MEIKLSNGEVAIVTDAFKVDSDGKRVKIPVEEVPPEIIAKLTEDLNNIKVQKCELCQAEHDCRPYGPKGQEVCPSCAAKDSVSTYLAAKAHKGEDYAQWLLQKISGLKNSQEYPTELSKMN